jgi:molybdate transport system substrate-binding protein
MRMQALAVATMLAAVGSIQANELKIIAATPMTAVIRDLSAQFEGKTGNKVAAKFVSGPVVRQRIDAGDALDLAVSITPVIDELIREGKLVADTRADVAYAPLGVGVRAGAAMPDISTVDAFRRALLAAQSVAHSETGASGEHFKRMIERLGISEQMKPKMRPMPADRIAQAVPAGEAEMIVVTLSVIMVPGAQVVGRVPPELQFYNMFAGAIGTNAQQPEGATAFLRLLTGPEATSVLRANGMESGVPR